jgi:hypothetical protein
MTVLYQRTPAFMSMAVSVKVVQAWLGDGAPDAATAAGAIRGERFSHRNWTTRPSWE